MIKGKSDTGFMNHESHHRHTNRQTDKQTDKPNLYIEVKMSYLYDGYLKVLLTVRPLKYFLINNFF